MTSTAHDRPDARRPRRTSGGSRVRLALAAALATGGVAVAVHSPVAFAAPPTLNAPERVYTSVDVDVPFSGTDPISGDNRALSIAASVSSCNTAGPQYSIIGCARVQLTLNDGFGGKIFVPGNTVVQNQGGQNVIRAASGAIVDVATDSQGGPSSIYHFAGTVAQINNTLANLVYQPGPGFESAEDNASNQPSLQIIAVDGVQQSDTTTKFIQFRVEGDNAPPVLTSPGAPLSASTAGPVSFPADTADPAVFGVEDDEQVAPDADGDDLSLLVATISCANATFALRGGVFSVLGSASLPTLANLLTSVSGLGLTNDQATPVAASIPLATALNFSTQSGSVNGDTTVFAGAAELDEIQYALSQVTFDTTAVADQSCTFTFMVSDLGNNGMPLAYVGSPIGGASQPQPGKETPNALGASATAVIEFENTNPDVVVTQAVGQADPTNGSPVNFTVVFSEAVSGFDQSDVDTSASTATTGSVSVTGGPSTYNVAVAATGEGTVTMSVPAGAATADAPPNSPNDASTAGDATVAFDAAAPTVTLETDVGQVDPTSTSPIAFVAQFSEPVTGFSAADVDLSTSTAGPVTAFVQAIDGDTYEVSISGMNQTGNVIATIGAAAATDAAGNASDASTSSDNSVGWVQPPSPDVTAPTVTINQANGQNDPTSSSPITFTAVFSEPVTGFGPADITLSGTAGGTVAVAGGPSTYTVSVTGMTQSGTVIVTVVAGAAADAAANPSEASTSSDNTVTYNAPAGPDVTPPTVTVEQRSTQIDPTTASPVQFTVTFSEPVTGFTASDVTIGGTAAPTTRTISGGPTVYTVNVTGMSTSGTVTASVAANRAIDAAGNQNLASTSTDNTVTFNVDAVAPTVTINQANGQVDPATASPVLFTVTFSEQVTGFITGDVTLGGTAGATTATVTGGPTVYTVNVSGMTTSGTVTATVAASRAVDGANNPNQSSTSTDNTVTFTETIEINTPGGNTTIQTSTGDDLVSFSTAAPSVTPPDGVTFPYGQLSFTATTTANDLVTFTITLPAPVTSYWKLVSGAWESFDWNGETGAQFNGNQVTVTIRDNGRGDSNPTAGIATDPGAPATGAVVVPSTTTTTQPGSPTTTQPGSPTTAPSGPTTVAPTTTTPVILPPTTTPGGAAPVTTVRPPGRLPATGGSGRLAWAALLLLAAGAVLLSGSRRRNVVN